MAVATKRITDVYVDRSVQTDRGRAVTRDRLIVGFLMVFVLGLSLFFFINQSLRLDEAQSLWQSSHNLSGLLKVIAQDVHVPFYHLLLHAWQFFFGNGVMWARILSLIFFMLTLPAMYMLGKLVYNRSVAIFGTLLLAISPFLNWYGNEIRMYSLFMLLIILSQYFFLKIYRDNTDGAWWGYAIIAAVGIFTHYFFFLGLVTHAIFFFIYRRRFPDGTERKFVWIVALVFVVFSPWVYYVYTLGLAGNSAPALTAPTTVNLFNTFSQFLFGFQGDHLNTILVSLWPLTILFGSLALRENRRISSRTVFLLMMLLIPIAMAFLVSSFIRPVFVTRYLILTVPSLYLFLGWVLSTYPKELRIVFKTVLVAAMLFALGIQATSATVPVKENYREVAEYLNTKTLPQDVVILSAPFTIYPIEYYYRGLAELRTLPIWNRYRVGPIPAFDDAKLEDQVNQLKGQHQVAWVVLSYNQGYEERVQLYFDSNFEQLESRKFSHGLNLYVYKLRYDEVSSEEIQERFPK